MIFINDLKNIQLIYDNIVKQFINIQLINELSSNDLDDYETTQHLSKQNRNRKKLSDLDEEARITQKVFRQFGLGEKYTGYIETEQDSLVTSMNDSSRDVSRTDDGTEIESEIYDEDSENMMDMGQEDDGN